MTPQDKKEASQHHSMVERQRRDRIKDCVQQLRQIVPASASKKKIQKLQILENAIRYIKQNQAVWESNNKNFTPFVGLVESHSSYQSDNDSNSVYSENQRNVLEHRTPPYSPEKKFRKMSIENLLS
ncbi:helix-loop-helix DNA-binding domain-containing protein [Globomyces pollinis-pini]|nr:helix-loop-helix DNA-binding domain-containing protein [Globomyces pollinis-pini]KAJ2991345.1 hypothetical protein HDV02_003849 [Globomyces sp. JEL0801]